LSKRDANVGLKKARRLPIFKYVIARLDRAIVRAQACFVQGGANPSQVILLRPVADRNCVTARWGGEQREATGSSVAKAILDSAVLTGEPAIERRSPGLCEQEAHDAEGLGDKAVMGAVRWLETEGPGGMERVKRGDLRGARGERILRYRPPQGAERALRSRLRAGVRALIVAMKPGNAGGAKGCRKVET
jgi:hypothetical protein